MSDRARPIVAAAFAASALLVASTLPGPSFVAAQTPPPPAVPSPPPSPSPSPSFYPGEIGHEVIVAQDGSGDFSSISEAVAAASDGDTVFIRRGTYEESVLVMKDIVIRGDDRLLVTIRPPAASPACGPSSTGGCALALVDTGGAVTGLTLETDPSEDGATALLVSGGAPYVDAVTVDGAIVVIGGSSATIRFSDVSGEIIVSGAGTEPTIWGNRMAGLSAEKGAAPTVRRNAFAQLRSIDSGGFVRGNSIVGSGREVAGRDGIGVDIVRPLDGLVIRENLIRKHRIGVNVRKGSSLAITSNNFERNKVGLRMDAVGDAKVRDNGFCKNGRSVRVESGPAPPDVKEFCSAGG